MVAVKRHKGDKRDINHELIRITVVEKIEGRFCIRGSAISPKYDRIGNIGCEIDMRWRQ